MVKTAAQEDIDQSRPCASDQDDWLNESCPETQQQIDAEIQCSMCMRCMQKSDVMPNRSDKCCDRVLIVRTQTWRPLPPGTPSRHQRPSPKAPPAPCPPIQLE